MTIAESGEKVELIPITPAVGGGGVVKNVTPQSQSTVMSDGLASDAVNEGGNAGVKEDNIEAGGFACMDPSKSTPARNLFRPINGETLQTDGQTAAENGVFNIKPAAKRPVSNSMGLGKGIMPQKRPAAHEANGAKKIPVGMTLYQCLHRDGAFNIKPAAKRPASKPTALGKGILPQKRPAVHEANEARKKTGNVLDSSTGPMTLYQCLNRDQDAVKIKQEYDSDAELNVENSAGKSAGVTDANNEAEPYKGGNVADDEMHVENPGDKLNGVANANGNDTNQSGQDDELHAKNLGGKSARLKSTNNEQANKGETVKQASKSFQKLDCSSYAARRASAVKTLELKRTVEVVDLCHADEEDVVIPPVITKDKNDFTKMNGTERRIYWSDKKKLAYFFKKTLTNLSGAECEVCAETGVDKSCKLCGRFFHGVCVDASCHKICLNCKLPDRQCHLCNQKGGIIVRTKAKPGSMKRWQNKKQEAFEESLFGKNNFCHLICGM